jgi:hypothetical protein
MADDDMRRAARQWLDADLAWLTVNRANLPMGSDPEPGEELPSPGAREMIRLPRRPRVRRRSRVH